MELTKRLNERARSLEHMADRIANTWSEEGAVAATVLAASYVDTRLIHDHEIDQLVAQARARYVQGKKGYAGCHQ